MLLFDFRQQKVVHAYRGFTGSIRQIACHPSKPFVVSVGLDRFVRVHHLDRQTPIQKAYLKSRLNAVLMRQNFDIEEIQVEDPTAETADVEKDLFWNTMEVIKDQDIAENEDPVPADQQGDNTPSKKGSLRKKRKTFS